MGNEGRGSTANFEAYKIVGTKSGKMSCQGFAAVEKAHTAELIGHQRDESLGPLSTRKSENA